MWDPRKGVQNAKPFQASKGRGRLLRTRGNKQKSINARGKTESPWSNNRRTRDFVHFSQPSPSYRPLNFRASVFRSAHRSTDERRPPPLEYLGCEEYVRGAAMTGAGAGVSTVGAYENRRPSVRACAMIAAGAAGATGATVATDVTGGQYSVGAR
jgi:hypothetical protein